MENCLKTQLKAEVNNNNLPFLGAFTITIAEVPSGSSKSRVLTVVNNDEDVTIRVVGNGYIQKSAALLESDPKTELVIGAGISSYIYSTNIDMTIIVIGKYNVSRVITQNNGNGNTSCINIDELEYSEKLERLEITSSLSKGNISSIKSTVITNIEVGETQVNGSIEDFVAVQYDGGRTTPATPVFISNSLKNITFGPSTHNKIRAHLLWDSKSKINIHYGDNTFANCTTVLERGYDSAEIKVWTDAGKTVTDVISGTVYPPTN